MSNLELIGFVTNKDLIKSMKLPYNYSPSYLFKLSNE